MQNIKSITGVLPAVLALALSSVQAAEDYSTWASYKNVVVNTKATGAGVGANVVNFPVLVRLDSNSSDVFAQGGTGGASIRFAKPSGAARPYQIESWDATAKKASIWVLADTVKGNDSTASLRMYWGKSGAVDSSKGSAVFDTANGYRAVFHMNEASGNINDASSNAIVGNDSGGTTSAAGIAGLGRNFGGTNAVNTNSTTDRQFIGLGAPSALNFTGRVAFSAWIRWLNVAPTGAGTHYRTIINRDGASPSTEAFLRIGHTSGNQDQSQYTTGKYASPDIFAQSPQLASAYSDSAQWVHLAGTYDSSAATPAGGLWRLYRNGVLVASDLYTGSTNRAITGNATRWRFGRGPGTNNNRWYAGDMDEVRIASVTRDSNYFKLDYQTQKVGTSAISLGTTQAGAPTAPSNLVYSPDSLQLNVGVAFSRVPTYVGAVDSFTVTPALPDSIKLNKTTGAIAGTPRAASAVATYVIRATNSLGFTTDTVYLSVTAVPPTNLVYPVQTVSYVTNATVVPNIPTVTGLVDSFTVAPALPAGLSFSKTTGAISGKPTAVVAAAGYIVTATNGAGTAKDTVNITVTAASADGLYSGWSNHKFITINTRAAGAAQSLRKFPLLVRLDSTNFNTGFSQAAFAGTDLRFTKTGDVVRLAHQIESWDAVAKRAAIWVLVDSVRGDNVTNIRMHWGKAGVADSSNGAAVFETANGFGAVWHMNEASGNLVDATSNAVVGTNNGTTATTGIIGGGRNFAGTNPGNNVTTGVQTISVGDPEGLDLGTGRVTLEAWVRWDRIRPTTGSTFWRNIIMRQSGADELHLRIDGNTPYNYRTGVYISSSDYGPLSEQSAAAYGDSAKWVHLTGVYDSMSASGNAWKLYRNGALVGSGSEGEPNVTGRGTWYIGSWSGTNNRRFWAGDMDEIRVSKTHRSASWVKLSYETQKAIPLGVSLGDTLTPPLALGRVVRSTAGSLSTQMSGQGALIHVQAGDAASFRLVVLDMRGREVWSQSVAGKGQQTVVWNGRSALGSLASSGVYTVRAILMDARGKTTGSLQKSLPLVR